MIYCEEIYLKGKFNMTIEAFTFGQRPDDHCIAYLSGYINPKDIEELCSMDPVQVCMKSSDVILFAGVIKEYTVTVSSGLHSLSLELISGTWLLDQEKKMISYQKRQAYKTLIEGTCGKHAQALYFTPDQEIDGLLVQYEETDWDFIKRLVSHLGTMVIPEVNHSCDGRFYVGLRIGYIIKNIEIHNYTELLNRRCYDQDFISYRIESSDNYQIGDYISWNNKVLQICEKAVRLVNGILCFEYLLSGKTYYQIKKRFNDKLHGKEIFGIVKETKGELLRLQLKTDVKSSSTDFFYQWMPESGNLMYCMPECKTCVTLYFCNDDEQSAICINCVRENAEAEVKKWIPKHKRFMTHTYKKLELKKNRMIMEVLDSQLMIDDEMGIVIKTEKGLDIQAEGELLVGAETVLVNSKKEIDLIKEDIFDPTAIVLKNDLDFKGKTARIQPHIWYGDKAIPERIFDQGKDLDNYDLDDQIMGMVARR